jgi:hypothetical protein
MDTSRKWPLYTSNAPQSEGNLLLRTILQLDGPQLGYRLRTSLGDEAGISHALGVEQSCFSLMNGGKLPTKAQLNPDLVCFPDMRTGQRANTFAVKVKF